MTHPGRPATPATQAVRAARDFLLDHPHDYDAAVAGFRWPHPDTFNFALEWFDVVAGEHPDRPAVTIAQPGQQSESWTYGELARRSDQVASWLRELGVKPGDLMVVMLNNTIDLWEILLGLLKVGAVAIPTSTLLSETDLAWRIDTVSAGWAIAPTSLAERFALVRPETTVIGVGHDVPAGWIGWSERHAASPSFEPDAPTPADATSLLYFTSGTTAHPKLVRHTQASYPIGHLSTMYWLGVRPGDVHLNISSPGWGKHAWSNFFAPFLAQATVFIVNYERFDARDLLAIMEHHKVSSFCAPPTVWRMLIQADLTQLSTPPREVVGAGEALNPEVINKVRAAWNNTIRDGFGQTEMTCCVGNSPGQPVRLGAMGRPMPGYAVTLLDPVTGDLVAGPGEGEICLDLSADNAGLMGGYYDAPELTEYACRGGFYHTGDIASRDTDGYLTYVGRADDVFKASDYKISPFELESALMLHDAVAECAVVPSPDAVRGAVPKAYVVLRPGLQASAEVAGSVFAHGREHLNGYQLVRILEFTDELPKTVSSKIRRVELRAAEAERVATGDTVGQFFYRDFR
ncbi:MAG TPA: AMP-binding protein [Propioniciclava sp.]|jgi:acetyl-CoA synthetase|uniref:AMP-binding protein n=1 Tax=Propioniciclava sp. TaxID=2038686 RepID=UPI002BAABC37|nr:AMP-binding protein [Propioniciclava sp.]HRL48717.1 AMP-binding protein [Propioniciclava sp.]HRL78743.1 AMP-binding protein [Propioniciclava sp.]